MKGKHFVITLVVSCAVMAFVVYTALKQSVEVRTHIAEEIRQEFVSYATEVKATQRLQVAELKQVELFERTSSLSLFWNRIKLPDVVVNITTPVTFIYNVDMRGAWQFLINGPILEVKAPPLEFSPPAPDLSATKFEVKKGSFFRDSNAVLTKLQTELTPLLAERANANKSLIRETARTSIANFITTWSKEKYKSQKDLEVKVYFPDEPAPADRTPP